jgi:hypothetical protein
MTKNATILRSGSTNQNAILSSKKTQKMQYCLMRAAARAHASARISRVMRMMRVMRCARIIPELISTSTKNRPKSAGRWRHVAFFRLDVSKGLLRLNSLRIDAQSH